MFANTTNSTEDLELFGPAMPSQFDFTPLFENTLLSILPSAVLLLVVPFRLRSLHNKTRKVSPSFLHSNKLAFLGLFTLFQATVLILYAANSRARSAAALTAASLVFADALGLMFLSHAEHVYSVRPSTIINTYLFFTLLFDIARTRTLWIQHSPKSIAAVFTGSTIIKIMICITEAVEKRRILLPPYQHEAPEATSGIYNRSFFWWLNPILTAGFRRNISEKDLFAIDKEMSSTVLRDRAQKAWKNATKTRSHALFWSTLKSCRRSLLVCIIPRLCLIGFRYAQPLLLERTVHFVGSRNDSSNIGWGLTGAFAVVFIGMAVASGSYYHMTYRFITSARGSLVSMIYAKTVDLSVISLNESAAITLMSNDTESICLALQNLHELWAVPAELAVAMYLLQIQLGVSFLAPAGVAIISTVSIISISKYIGGAQKIWNQGIQTRVDVTASMLGSMKAVKILGFTGKLTDILQGLRVKELRLSSLFRRLLCARVFFANSMTTIAPLVTFALFVPFVQDSGRELTASMAYTTLSLIGLLASPVNTLLRTIPALTASLACFDRIQSFLESESRRNYILPISTPSNCPTDRSRTAIDSAFDAYNGIELTDLSPAQRQQPDVIMDVRNASFAWDNSATPIVDDVSFSVLRQSSIFIVGPVGCGKSTLLKGLMSETPSLKGFVYSDSTEIAFIDQTPWIQNTSIRQNIIGQSRFEQSWLDEVIRASALDYDIAGMLNGDQSLVGSRGISLSGGQKQRLAIARALYARKELMIIDDAFSGLDADTEEKVFVRLFGKQGLLKQIGTTVIIVTHAIHRLPYADHIIALNATGHITEQGSFEDLQRAGGYIQSLAVKYKYDNGPASSIESTEVEISSAEPRTDVVENDKFKTEHDDLNRPVGELSTYKYYFGSIGWKTCLMNLLIQLVGGISIKMMQLVLKYWTAAVAERGHEVNSFYLGIYGMLGAFGIIGSFIAVYHYFLYIVPGSSEQLHARLLEAVMGAPLYFFTSTDTGTTTNRFSQDMSVVDVELPYALIDLILSAIQTVMGAILMCLSAGYFALTLPPVMFVIYLIQKYYLRTSRQIRILDLEAKSPLYTHFIESLSGLVTIRAFGWAPSFMEQNLALLDASQKPYYLLFCIQRWLALVMDLMVSGLAIVLMIIVVKLRDSIGAGFVGLALLNVMGFSESLAWNVRQWTALETSMGAIARLKNFASLTPSENLDTETQPIPANWPTRGAIEFKNVSASYTPDGLNVLRNINISIKAGEKIGLCGRSGSGKSSFIMTLFRMLELDADSTVTVDGVDIATVPRQGVRSAFNAIPQDPFFFKGSIRDNAVPEITHIYNDAVIIAALRTVQLWDVVNAKGGLDAVLDAEFFSHGQRQLFCLARALLRRSKVVVLDEVSSSVDVETDRVMQTVIRREFATATVLVIAHRLDTIIDFDRVVVMGNGEVVEVGVPGELLARGSAFRELYYS